MNELSQEIMKVLWKDYWILVPQHWQQNLERAGMIVEALGFVQPTQVGQSE